jgi:hypothetical protein
MNPEPELMGSRKVKMAPKKEKEKKFCFEELGVLCGAMEASIDH